MRQKYYHKNTVGFYSLGCAKNLADSEVMLGLLVKEGFQIVDPLGGAEIIIINTCGFIEDAKEESIEAILEAVKLKNDKKCRYLVVAGCLSQRYGQQLFELIPEVDRLIGISQLDQLGWICRNLPDRATPLIEPPGKLYPINDFPKVHIPPGHYAYLKIAEGCRNNCSYCVIPMIRGTLHSREPGDIMEEAAFLSELNVREVNVVGQDITAYGEDLQPRTDLVALLEKLLDFPSFRWIRLLYTHPYHLSDGVLELMRSNPRVVPYLDLPIQHVDPGILKKMGRVNDTMFFYRLFDKIKSRVPNISLRTTVMVGFPGETEAQFERLHQFIKDIRFNHLGVFRYSREPGTPAARMRRQVDDAVKQEREKRILESQAEISKQLLKHYWGQSLEVLVEDVVRTRKNGFYTVARAPFQAPEVDGSVYIKGRHESLKNSDFYRVSITDSNNYDLFAEWSTPPE